MKKKKPWTIGNYLLMMKKSPSSVKIGVGYIELSDLSSSSDDGSVCAIFFYHDIYLLPTLINILAPAFYPKDNEI